MDVFDRVQVDRTLDQSKNNPSTENLTKRSRRSVYRKSENWHA